MRVLFCTTLFCLNLARSISLQKQTMEQKSQARCTKSNTILIIDTSFHFINTLLSFEMLYTRIMYNQNPNLNLDPSNFQEQILNFPEPFLDYHVFDDQSLPMPNCDPPVEKTRKDRHRKICTAQGVRGRRMRLPFQVARKFFDLQDMLGFDRAAKTIEWLMTKSQGAIQETARNVESSTSGKCENRSSSSDGERKKRQLRENARTRARERTREKMMKRSIQNFASSSSNPNSSFDSSSSHQSLYKQFSNVGIDSDCLNPVFDNLNSLGLFFLGD